MRCEEKVGKGGTEHASTDTQKVDVSGVELRIQRCEWGGERKDLFSKKNTQRKGKKKKWGNAKKKKELSLRGKYGFKPATSKLAQGKNLKKGEGGGESKIGDPA